MSRKELISSAAVVFLLSFGARAPLASRHPLDPGLQGPFGAARAGEDEPGKDEGKNEGKDEGKNDGKDDGKDEGEDGNDDGKGDKSGDGEGEKDKDKPQGKSGDSAEPEAGDLASFHEEVPADEVDQKSPRFINKAKDTIPYVMVRPSVPRVGKAPEKAGKKAIIDGSRWGFVDLEKRRNRLSSFYDKFIALHEKQRTDESRSEDEREYHRKQINLARAEKSRKKTELEPLIGLVELVGTKGISLMVVAKERAKGMTDKSYRDALKKVYVQNNYKVITEREEKWRGSRMPGCTLIAEGGSGAEPIWKRITYFVVPQQKGPVFIVQFECQAPKSAVNEQLEQEVEALIKGTSFN
jgi:hypothetical protein